MVNPKKSSRARAQSVMRTFSVIAQDPSVTDAHGHILMAKIRVPPEHLEPGPIGYRVQVVDYDSTEGHYHGAHTLPATFEKEPKEWTEGRPSIVGDFGFHAQNVYALVMKTLARFEHALGRRIGWRFRTHQLKIAPHGMLDANAFYTPDDEGLVFGYFNGLNGQTVYSCLSQDVVVHETTHALLDALRERFLDPSSPDQAAFHEGFSDVVALLTVFAQQELVQELLRRGRRKVKGLSPDMIHESDVTEDRLTKSALFGLAEEMGKEMEGVRGGALRRSAELSIDPTLKDTEEFLEPHRRGELLVAAVLLAFIRAWAARIKGLKVPGQKSYSLARVAEQGADIADVLVTLWIRAIDYMPPVHLEFGDALSAALTADVEARPDDSRYRLRDHIRKAFEDYGFGPAAGTNADGTWERAPLDLNYDNVRFESMRSDKDEVFRFLWENREVLNLGSGAYAQVLSLRPCTRVGEDGFTLRETVAEYYQVARLTEEELDDHEIDVPAGWREVLKAARQAAIAKRGNAPGKDHEAEGQEGADEEEGEELVTPVYGGGTLIFDEYGKLKYHVHNDVFGSRQPERLKYLFDTGQLKLPRKRTQFSAGRLSALHRLRALDLRRFPQEGW